jgi:hypothetical protein
MNSPKVEYRLVNQYLKPQCSWCATDATQEAIKQQGNITVISRCCDDPKCMKLSVEMCERTVAA